jgi:hypothetical protein
MGAQLAPKPTNPPTQTYYPPTQTYPNTGFVQSGQIPVTPMGVVYMAPVMGMPVMTTQHTMTPGNTPHMSTGPHTNLPVQQYPGNTPYQVPQTTMHTGNMQYQSTTQHSVVTNPGNTPNSTAYTNVLPTKGLPMTSYPTATQPMTSTTPMNPTTGWYHFLIRKF